MNDVPPGMTFPDGQGQPWRSVWRFGNLSRPWTCEQIRSVEQWKAGRRPRFVAIWYTTALSHLSLGLHVDLLSPNIEIHLPGGFFRVGWCRAVTVNGFRIRSFGIEQEFRP